jgi:hypothetical protein
MQRLRRFLHWLRTQLIRLVIGRRPVVANIVFQDQGDDRFTFDERNLLALATQCVRQNALRFPNSAATNSTETSEWQRPVGRHRQMSSHQHRRRRSQLL